MREENEESDDTLGYVAWGDQSVFRIFSPDLWVAQLSLGFKKKKKMLSHMCIFHHQRALVPQAAAAISNQACGMGKQGKK